MGNITVTVQHNLGQDEALKRVKTFVSEMKTQYGSKASFEESWNGNVGTFSGSGSGVSASGTVTVNPADVTVDLTVPAIVMFMKGTVESGMRQNLERVLA